MIVLLNCSTSWSKSNTVLHSSTGRLLKDTTTNDSVLIAYDDLRKVNGKLIELKYQKEINNKLNTVIRNDSVIISNYRFIVNKKDKQIKRYKKQQKYFIAGGIGVLVLFITSLFK